MGILAASRSTIEHLGHWVTEVPVKAATKIFVGGLTAIDASGYAVPASDTAALKVLGRCEGMSGPGITGLDADNSGGANGAISVNVKRSVFKFDNSAGNAITAAQLGKACFVEDDHTVNKDGGVNKIKAGVVFGLEDSGASVWVDTAPGWIAADLGLPISYALTSVQEATVNGSDAGTTQALVNSLKIKYNALQADVAAILALLTS